MAELFEYPDGATPLDPEEEDGLRLGHITTRGELNTWEQKNILEAERWSTVAAKRVNILTREFIKELHRRMFDKVWKWAGTFRSTGKNLGVAANQIPGQLLHLLDDVGYWIENETYPADEIAVRFHHRLTLVHPFPNGNGRHARLMVDVVLVHLLDCEPFTWGGGGNLVDNGECRQRYIAALRKADLHEYEPLQEFVRS